MNLEKPIRKRNRVLIDFLKQRLECCACSFGQPDMDHITSVGAGGNDAFENLWPLCRLCHIERHAKGLVHMAKVYPGCRDYLKMLGRYDEIKKREEKFKK